MTEARPTPRAVIFDCDGVVMERHGIPFGPLSERLEQRGKPLNRGQLRELLRGLTPESFVARVLKHDPEFPVDWLWAEYDRIIAKLADGAKLVPGIIEVLDTLDAVGIRYALGSNGPILKLKVMLAQHPGLAERFGGHIHSAQSLPAPKPAPNLHLHAAATLGIRPSHCAVVDDGILGVTAAVAAGMPGYCFAAHDDAASLAKQAAELADYNVAVFHHMRELPGVLGL